jgi:branched-chain amino acid transport system substrate-binding protein
MRRTHRTRRTPRWMAAAVPLCAAVTAIAGCSSSGSSGSAGTSSGGSDSSAGTTSSGSISIMALGVFASPVFVVPQVRDAVLLAAKTINAAGGVNGKKINVIVCNDQNDANVAGQCARQAVTDHVAAVVAQTSLVDEAVIPILEAANIPDIGPQAFSAEDTEASDKVAFGLGTIGTPDGVADAVYLQKEGCTNIGIVYTSPGGDTEVAAPAAAIKSLSGVKYAGAFAVNQQTTNWTPAVQKAISAGGQNVCLVLLAASTQMIQVFQGISSSTSPHMRVAAYENELPISILPTLGGKASGAIITSGFYPTNSPQAASLATAFTAAYPKDTFDEQVEDAWVSVYVFAEIAKGLSTVNASTVLAALNKATDVTDPLLPKPLNFTTPNSDPAFARIFNTSIVALKVNGSSASLLYGGQSLDVSKYLAAAG